MAEQSTGDNNSQNLSRKLPPISPRSLPSPFKTKKKKAANKSNVESDDSLVLNPDSEPKVQSNGETNKKTDNSRLLPQIQTSSSENVSNEKRQKKKKSGQSSSETPPSDEILTENGLDQQQTNGTPKKKKKKKKKTESDKEVVTEEYLNTLLYDLGSIEEDIVTSPVPPADLPISLGTPVIHSQPADMLYIETNRNFKAAPKSNATIISTGLIPTKDDRFNPVETIPQQTTLEFAISTHQIWKCLCLFTHGLTAGIGLWHIVMVMILNNKGDQEFLEVYGKLALPMQSIFYTLLVICLVSVCDRYDISNITHSFLLRSLTLQTGAVSVIIYFMCLILSVSMANIDDKMFLHSNNTRLFNTSQELEEDLSLWKIINIVRGIGVVFGWLVLSVTPDTDRLTESLSEVTDNVLGIIVHQEGRMNT